jgi:protease IV
MQPSPSSGSSGVRQFFYGIWRALDISRRVVLNLIFLLFLVILVAVVLTPKGPTLLDKTALVIDIKGKVVEEMPGGLRQKLLGQAGGGSDDKTQLRDIVAALDAAAKDKRIDRVVLFTDEFTGAGLASLREIALAMERFKASGKQIVAYGSNFDQRSYYLAAHASEVFLHPMGMAMMEGFGRYRNYYRDAFDRLGLSANVLRVGTYKNFAEPYFANAPSAASLEAEGLLFGDMWNSYLAAVEKARKLPAGSIMQVINELPERFAKVKGDAGKLAIELKWVDGLKTPDELRAVLIERGARDEAKKTFRQIGLDRYLSTLKPKKSGDAVGIIVAEGEIVDGTAPAGRVGGVSTAELIRKARDDDAVKAIVLRVNSPGGSAFASELIRRELEQAQKAGKPVVISMGDVAASGGYWISMSADEVIADPATITGSIGVVAMLPTGEKAMEKISVNAGGTHTTWLAGAYDPRRPLDPRFAGLVQTAIERIYTDFTSAAAKARKTTPDKIDAVGQGRVWTGRQALERGLVDKNGSLGDAIASAKSRAKLADDARVAYIEPDGSTADKVLRALTASVGEGLTREIASAWLAPMVPVPNALREVQRDLAWVQELSKTHAGAPFFAVAHCFCEK